MSETTPCTGKPAHPATVINIARMTGLDLAAGMLGGQRQLAEVLGIQERSLRSKLTADRGVADDELLAVAAALEARAKRILDLAGKLRTEAGE